MKHPGDSARKRLCPLLLLASPLCLGSMALLASGEASSQAYPTRPVRMIIPLAPGGGMDTIARGIAQKLTESLGYSVVVDNRGGGSGTIAAELVARSAPDGYTLIMLSATSVIYPLMYKSARYDALRDFTPVSQCTSQPYIIVVNPAVPAKSVSELIAYSKANPDKLNYASSGNGSLIHLTGELFKASTGASMVHVPYKGIGAAYPDLIAGQIQLTFASIISGLPQVKSQRLRALAVTGAQRTKSAPDVPTVSESGVKGFVVNNWYGILLPANAPRPIVDRLHQEIVKTLKLPEVIARMETDGADPVGNTPQQFGAHIKAEGERWQKVIKQAGIKGE